MITCRECGHSDMVHFMWIGCCGHAQCPCEGLDGSLYCRRERHDEQCWWAYPHERKPDVSEAEVVSILALHLSGKGTRTIARNLGLKRPLVQRTIRNEAVA